MELWSTHCTGIMTHIKEGVETMCFQSCIISSPTLHSSPAPAPGRGWAPAAPHRTAQPRVTCSDECDSPLVWEPPQVTLSSIVGGEDGAEPGVFALPRPSINTPGGHSSPRCQFQRRWNLRHRPTKTKRRQENAAVLLLQRCACNLCKSPLFAPMTCRNHPRVWHQVQGNCVLATTSRFSRQTYFWCLLQCTQYWSGWHRRVIFGGIKAPRHFGLNSTKRGGNTNQNSRDRRRWGAGSGMSADCAAHVKVPVTARLRSLLAANLASKECLHTDIYHQSVQKTLEWQVNMSHCDWTEEMDDVVSRNQRENLNSIKILINLTGRDFSGLMFSMETAAKKHLYF